MKPTKTQVKNLFNYYLNDSERRNEIQFVKVDFINDSICIQVTNNSKCIFSEFYIFKFFYFVPDTKKTYYTIKTSLFIEYYNFLIRDNKLNEKFICKEIKSISDFENITLLKLDRSISESRIKKLINSCNIINPDLIADIYQLSGI